MSDGFRILLDWLLSHLVDLQIAALNALSTLCWWAEKLGNAIATFLMSEDLWSLLLDGLLQTATSAAPSLFQTLLFSPTGLFYIALCLAGVLLIISYGDRQIAEPSQVLLWGLLVSALFVSTTLGYDLVGQLEAARRWTALEAMTAVAPNGEVSDLITIPMRATPEEVTDLGWTLPAQFTTAFYYEPTEFITQSAVLVDTWLTGQIILEVQVEVEAAQETRKQAAWQGVLLAVLTLAPAAIEAMFGLIFATIAASVLVLIIFFLAVLPLGFFSFGKAILHSIVSQYTFLWALTLAGSIFVGLLLGTGQLFLPGTPDLAAVVSYLPILVVVAIALSYLLRLTLRAMQGTLGMVSATLRTTLSERAQNTTLPAAGDVPLLGPFQQAYGAAQSLAGLAVMGVAAAATGGGSVVLPALAGGLLSRTSPETGRDAAVLARISSDSPVAQTFAAAAYTPETLPAISGILSVTSNGRSSQAQTPTTSTDTPPSDNPLHLPNGRSSQAQPPAAPTDTPGHLPDGRLVSNDPIILSALSQAYHLDESDLADLLRVVREGLARAVSEGIESGLAVGQAIEGQLADHPAFKTLSRDERSHLGQQAAHLLTTPPQEPDAPMTSLLSPTPGKLAHLTRNPVQAPPEVDIAALHQVHQLTLGWETEELTQLYQAGQIGLTQARQRGGSPRQAVQEAMSEYSQVFNQLPARQRSELARHTLLVMDSLPAESTPPQVEKQPPGESPHDKI